MSYYGTGDWYGDPSILIARRGYGGNGRRLNGRPQAVGFLDTIKEFGGKVLNLYGETKAATGREEAYKEVLAAQMAQQKAATPSWVMPVLVVGGLATALILLRRRKRAVA